ncbi:TonB-dependent receptor [Gammaproteobacteria bacterium 42_54_T18]|nr:TonB-dependent receptor [Gammaproteobacteria bacterium 42_54_T18]
MFLSSLALGLVSTTPIAATSPSETSAQEETLHVWGKQQDSRAASYTNPTSVLTPEDMVSINITTTEDVVKYEPSLVIRRRFIGDSNGTLGIRGSNMFQTSRSMVFADGVPLHYFLESRWNGAPRWTMVSASEIAQVEVLYGPFSAEYSGNSMGGVVLIETAIPQEREFHIDGTFFTQEFDDYGFDDNVSGFKGFMSFGDKVGDLSYFLSYNHLENDSQPQIFREAKEGGTGTTSVSGAIIENDRTGNEKIWYGDTGIVNTITDNYKFKLGYDFGNWSTLLNVAYEDRRSTADSANSYVKDDAGNTIWSESNAIQGEQEFSFNSTGLNVSEADRESLSVGIRIKGDISDTTQLEVNINRFDILHDEERSSEANPNDPDYTSEGEIEDYDDSGWKTAEVKLTSDNFGAKGVQVVTGVRHETYELNTSVYDSPDYASGTKGAATSRSGGKTTVSAIYSQLNWDINTHWDMAFGLRYEYFKSYGGYYENDNFELTSIPSNSTTKASPKFSVGYQPTDEWLIRYSIAKAYRFPIVEELFSQYEKYNTASIANPGLKPENGLHHNLMFDKLIDGGYLRVNIFQETIKKVIESQTDTSTGLRTFIPIDEVNTSGIEFIANIMGVFNPQLDMRFNLTYVDSEITKNDPDPELEDNQFPRTPHWRSNLLATYHINTQWNVGGSVQYASNSFGRLDNTDKEDNVYGAQDAYTRLGLKTAYAINKNTNVSLGVDNLTNEISYVAHPWPGRTYYLNMSYDM